jgi:hypothetical protein
MTETTVRDANGECDSPVSVRATVKYLAGDHVQIGNARIGDTNHSLDHNGFALVAHRSAIEDFYDQASVDSVYTSEVEALIGKATGARRVAVFDHTRRSDTVSVRREHSIREPSAAVHNDYTDRSGPQRVRDILADEAEALLSGGFAIVNLWRAMRNPVLTSPLAICDASSLDAQDLVATERRARDRIGEIYLVRFNPAHRWWYFPRLQLDEAILIKTFDSAVDGRARFAVHTAFDDPTSPPGAPPRESIETRAFVFL